MVVVPKTIVLLVNAPLGMLVNVFDAPDMVLLVSVSVVALPTKVSVEVGSVSVPVLTIVEMTGAVSVLFVSVWVAVVVTTGTPSTVALVDALKVVKAPELAVVAPIGVLSIDPPVTVAPVTVAVAIVGLLNVPPVTVFPVKVKAAGKDRVTVVVPVEVISFDVPLTTVTAPIAVALIATLAAAVS